MARAAVYAIGLLMLVGGCATTEPLAGTALSAACVDDFSTSLSQRELTRNEALAILNVTERLRAAALDPLPGSLDCSTIRTNERKLAETESAASILRNANISAQDYLTGAWMLIAILYPSEELKTRGFYELPVVQRNARLLGNDREIAAKVAKLSSR